MPALKILNCFRALSKMSSARAFYIQEKTGVAAMAPAVSITY
jgi:hypothetical protein